MSLRGYKGVFDGFFIRATLQADGAGRAAWHVYSQLNSGDFDFRDYWVADGQFRKTLVQTVQDDGGLSTLTQDVETDTNDPEQQAILKAIAAWSERNEESTT